MLDHFFSYLIYGTFYLSKRFAELGAKVVLLDINEQANSAVADEINASGNKAYAYACDCSKREAIYQTAAHVSLHCTYLIREHKTWFHGTTPWKSREI